MATLPSALEKWADQPWIAHPRIGGTVVSYRVFNNLFWGNRNHHFSLFHKNNTYLFFRLTSSII